MHRHKATQSDSIFMSGCDIPAENENGWLARQFLVYAERLVSFVELSPAAVTFLVEILPQKDRWALLETLQIEAPQETTLTGRPYQVEVTDALKNWLKSKDAASAAKRLRGVLSEAISRRLLELNNNQDETESSARSRFFEEMDEFASLFTLSHQELSIVALCYCYSVLTGFEGLCDSIAKRNQLRFLSACIQMPPHETATLLHRQSNFLFRINCRRLTRPEQFR